MAATQSIFSSHSVLTQSMERLGTGKRINSAADDAAGLQIATRLTGQTNGMKVAQRNISDANSLLQTAEGSLDEVTNMLFRMKDLATQAANDTNPKDDRDALSKEYNQLDNAIFKTIVTTTFAGQNLFAEFSAAPNSAYNMRQTGSLVSGKGLNVQIGEAASDSMLIKISNFSNFMDDMSEVGLAMTKPTYDIDDVENPQFGIDFNTENTGELIKNLEKVIGTVSSMRSEMGAKQNRLAHTAANLQNMQDNLSVGLGNIQDADYATEASRMTRSQMLAQTSMSMLKQSNSMSSMVQSLLN